MPYMLLPGLRAVLFSFTSLLLAGAASGQGVPDWYLSLPADPAVIAGRGAVERGGGSDATALAQAKREAMRDLSESLLCRLTSEIIDHQQEHSAAGAESQFASRTVVESALELVNVRTLHEAVTRDMAFVVVAVDRAEMARAYRDRTSRLFTTAQQAFEQAGTLEAANDARSALSAYEACLAALRDARGALQVYLALNRWNDGGLDVPAVPDATDVETRLKRLACATPTVTATINFVACDVAFTSASGAEGLLIVYWNTNVIGTVDERTAPSGLQPYRFPLAEDMSSGVFALGFRLDSFTNIASGVTVTNVTTGFAGDAEPFVLGMTNGTSGVVMTLAAPSNYNYIAHASTNLADWTPFAILVNTNGTVPFFDPAMSNYQHRFYRVTRP